MIAPSSSSLSRLPAAIRVLGYDRLRLHPRIEHIGVGSFHSPTRRSICSGSSARRERLGHQRPRDPSAVLAATIHGGWFDDLDAPVSHDQVKQRGQIRWISSWGPCHHPRRERGGGPVLDPEVGRAVVLGDLTPFERAAQRIKRAEEIAPTHPANHALRRLELNQ